MIIFYHNKSRITEIVSTVITDFSYEIGRNITEGDGFG